MSMENTLRCNALKCRREVNDKAVVTTCSHIFCLECADQLQLSNPPPGQRPFCPACDVHLNNPDDAVITNLNPTEDYKTSVLSGLGPTTIMECAGRALSFWTYQTSQEVVYQGYLAKSLTDKCNGLNSQMDKVIHDANSLISDMRKKMSNMSVDQENLRRKNEELYQALRERNKKCLQTRELYDKLKRRTMIGQVQNAASDAVDYTLQQSSLVNNRYSDSRNTLHQPPPQSPLSSGAQNICMQGLHFHSPRVPSMPPPVARPPEASGWSEFISNQEGIHKSDGNIKKPLSHRQLLAPSTSMGGILNSEHDRRIMTPSRLDTPLRQTVANASPNTRASRSGFSGYGMSAGLKISHPQIAAPPLLPSRSTMRSQVAQRPSLALNGDHGDRYY